MDFSTINKFVQDGFVLYDPKINNQTLIKARDSFEKIIKICQNQKYKYVRVYDDYSNLINIAGIEMIFDEDLIDQNIINLVEESKIVSIAKKILNNEDFVLVLSRYHVTKKYTHLGIWHRDAEPNNPDSVQLNIYLYDETGMEIIPKSHNRNNSDTEEEILNKFPYNHIPSQFPIKAKAGDVCIFNPSLIHRGKTTKDRVHLHFRFIKKKKLNKKSFLIDKSFLKKFDIENELLTVISNSLDYENRKLRNEHVFKNNIRSKLLRLVRRFLHTFLFFLPIQNKLNSFFSVRPCLNKRSIFKIKN